MVAWLQSLVKGALIATVVCSAMPGSGFAQWRSAPISVAQPQPDLGPAMDDALQGIDPDVPHTRGPSLSFGVLERDADAGDAVTWRRVAVGAGVGLAVGFVAAGVIGQGDCVGLSCDRGTDYGLYAAFGVTGALTGAAGTAALYWLYDVDPSSPGATSDD